MTLSAEQQKVGQRVRFAVSNGGVYDGFKTHFGRIVSLEEVVQGRRYAEVVDEEAKVRRRLDTWDLGAIEDGKVYVRVGEYHVEGVVVSSTVKRTKVRSERVSYRNPRSAVWADRLNVLLALPDGSRIFGIAPAVAQEHGVQKGDVIAGHVRVKHSGVNGWGQRREGEADEAFGFITGWGNKYGGTPARLFRNGQEVGGQGGQV